MIFIHMYIIFCMNIYIFSVNHTTRCAIVILPSTSLVVNNNKCVNNERSTFTYIKQHNKQLYVHIRRDCNNIHDNAKFMSNIYINS